MAILGTDGDDTITPGFTSPGVQGGPPGADVDTIAAAGGNDLVQGGAGRDSLAGGDGADTLQGGADSDTIAGGAGADSLDAGEGLRDWLSYRDDTAGVTVDLAARTAAGGLAAGDRILGFDALEGGSGDDVLASAIGSSLINTGVVDGGAGRDLLRGQGGFVWQRGGEGLDTLIGAPGDTLEGGAGADSILGAVAAAAAYEASPTGVTVDLSLADGVTGLVIGRGGDAEGDSLDGVANVYGSLLADLLTGDAGPNNLRGRDGDDTLAGGDGDDTLEGGLGRNLQFGGAGDDSLRSRENIDTLHGGEGDDTFAGGGLVFGEAGDDVLLVDGQFLAAQAVEGGEGNDRLTSPGFDDRLDGGAGSDTIDAGAGQDTILGGDDADSLLGGAGDDSILGGAGDDTLVGLEGTDRLDGGAGRDWLDLGRETRPLVVVLDSAGLAGVEGIAAGSGADLLEGGAGDDTLLGGGGADTLRDSAGNDSLSGGTGDDSLVAELGFDTLDGGPGADRLEGMGAVWLDYRADSAGVTVDLAGATGRGGLAEGDRYGGGFAALLGGSGADRLTAFDWHTSLVGGEGNDTLSGGIGNAEMFGGAGDDDYLVRNRYDLVTEAAGDGRDRIVTTLATLSLPDHVEQLAATGGGPRRLRGNALDNTIAGSGGDDTLQGDAGRDDLLGGRGADRMWGGSGDDRFRVDNAGDRVLETARGGRDSIFTTLAVLELPWHVEQLYGMAGAASRLSGNALDNLIRGSGHDDTLSGGAGADTLEGGIGADLLIGGAGGDLYRADADDVVIEAAGPGADTIIAANQPLAVLAPQVEVLVLQGGAALDGIGNALDNTLIAQAGNNLLRGLAGRDSLWGGGGADTLVGGLGADTLVGGAQGDLFQLDLALDSLPEARDLVADFRAAEGDRVDLRGIDANGLLAGNQGFVWIGTAEFSGGGAAGAGQWRVAAAGPGHWRGEGDMDGDGAADVAIEILAATAALEGWFLL